MFGSQLTGSVFTVTMWGSKENRTQFEAIQTWSGRRDRREQRKNHHKAVAGEMDNAYLSIVPAYPKLHEKQKGQVHGAHARLNREGIRHLAGNGGWYSGTPARTNI